MMALGTSSNPLGLQTLMECLRDGVGNFACTKARIVTGRRAAARYRHDEGLLQ